MKFFRWGRKKDPPSIQPTTHQDEFGVTKSDAAATSIRSSGTTADWGSRDAVEGWPESLPRLSKDIICDFSPEARVPGDIMPAGSEAVAWEVDRLQETIRFVFSHEQEGLLAIGTFALDQLAGVRLGLDGILKPPATTDDQRCSNNSHRNSVSSVQLVLRELRSSDDEMPLNTPACKRKELPVFGDHDALSDLYPRVALPVETSKPLPLPIVLKLTPKDVPSSTNSGIDSQQADTHETGKRDEMLHVPEVAVSSSTIEYYQSDEEFYSPGACGLFASRSCRRTQKLGEKEKRKKLPPEKRVGNTDSSDVKKTDRSKGFSSLGQLWRSGCNGPPPTAEVTPEPQLLPERESSKLQVGMQVSGVPCIANVAQLEGGTGAAPVVRKAGEGGGERKRRGKSFGKGSWACAQNGKWIRTDSEFVVLEM